MYRRWSGGETKYKKREKKRPSNNHQQKIVEKESEKKCLDQRYEEVLGKKCNRSLKSRANHEKEKNVVLLLSGRLNGKMEERNKNERAQKTIPTDPHTIEFQVPSKRMHERTKHRAQLNGMRINKTFWIFTIFSIDYYVLTLLH